jgi:hypothetical protein
MTEWAEGVTAYFRGEHRQSLAHLDNAERIMPGFPDIRRLRADAEMKVDKYPRFMQRGKSVGLGVGVALVGVLFIVGVRTFVRGRTQSSPAGVQRIGPEEIRRRLETKTGAVLVDARHGANFDDSPVQAAGALRYDVDNPNAQALRVRMNPDGEVVVYCD